MRPQGNADLLECRRRLAIRLLGQGLDPPDVATATGATVRSVQRWRADAGVDGESSPALAAVPHRGAAAKLTATQAADVCAWLADAPSAFGFAGERWTAPRVAELIARAVRRVDEPPVPQPLAAAARRLHAAVAAAASGRTRRGDGRPLGPRRVAAHQKKAARLGATLAFSDEAGFLLMPLVKTTLAPRGHTPVLRHRARRRDKVSVAAALTVSPARGRVGLHCRTYPGGHVDAEIYAWFLRECLLREVRGPVVLVQDNGQMHRGPAVRQVQCDHPRLDLEQLPPYAPELNPTEGLWSQSKDKELANFVPADVEALNDAVCDCLSEVRHDQHRLRSFFKATPLSWRGTTLAM